MNKLTKEECEKALETFQDFACLKATCVTDDNESINKTITNRIEFGNCMAYIQRLIDEHFELKDKYSKILDDCHDYRHESHTIKMTIINLMEHFGVKNEQELKNIYLNKPYEFEELKTDMWVWDNSIYEKNYAQIKEVIVHENNDISIAMKNDEDKDVYIGRVFKPKRFYPREVK